MKYQISKITKDPNYKASAPFHGDQIFIDIISGILEKSEFFIETGTAYGDTLKFMADNFSCTSISCEPDNERYEIVSKYVENAEVVKTTSPEIFEYVKSKYPESHQKTTTFWLDAHGEYNGLSFWPLRDELDFIFKNYEDFYILIDDFKNPFVDKFCYDVVDGIDCGLDYVKDMITDYNVYFPNYTEVVNDAWHSLVGWVLITKTEINDTRLIKI